MIQKLIDVIRANFPNGIRDDFIDTGKALRIYSAAYGDENISRRLLMDIIHAKGIADGGRFYFISADDEATLKNFFDELLRANPIVYYCTAYKRHADFFGRLNIFSAEVLRKTLQAAADDNFYFEEFCSARRATRLKYEVSKLFMAAGKSLSLDDVQGLLPYVPPDKILSILDDDKRYLPTTAGEYVSINQIPLDIEEIHAAKQEIFSVVNAKGCAAPEDYNLSSNVALNPELSERALRNVICEKFFSTDFVKRGKKLFKRGSIVKRDSKESVNRLREFVAGRNELSTGELSAFAKSLELQQSVALSVAYETMIRVDKNLFVADSLISFDVAGVDEALTSFVRGKIISLRAVESFTGFPKVAGYSWNLFMLESFLRKFSRQYVFDTPAANSALVGAIYPKAMTFEDYLDVQASVLVQEHIPLEKSSVEEFLIGQGFRAKRIDKITARIILRAQEYRRA